MSLHGVPRPQPAPDEVRVGDTIWDGLAVSKVTGEGRLGRLGPAWRVRCIVPFTGQESLVLKDSVKSVMPRRDTP